jgi:hypothetical protein
MFAGPQGEPLRRDHLPATGPLIVNEQTGMPYTSGHLPHGMAGDRPRVRHP